MKLDLNNATDSEQTLLNEFTQLWEDADKIWEQESATPAFAAYVSADYMPIYEQLKLLRSQADTFLEWGSGLGVVTIMASRMGFDASGVEAESELVRRGDRVAGIARLLISACLENEFVQELIAWEQYPLYSLESFGNHP